MIFPTDYKIVDIEEAIAVIEAIKNKLDAKFTEGNVKKLLDDNFVFGAGLTNGVFDILHPGHIFNLVFCKQKCEFLTVLINSDDCVRELKGPNRPIQPQLERAQFVASLECVGQVIIWDKLRITEALQFLRPNLWFKGGDYTLETLDQDERMMAQNIGVNIIFTPTFGDFSSSKRISELPN